MFMGFISFLSNETLSTCILSLKAKMPWFWSHRAIDLHLRIRYYHSTWSSLSVNAGSISLSAYVPRDAPIVKACERGDEAKTRQLFQARQAGPNDCFFFEDPNDSWMHHHEGPGGDYSLLSVGINTSIDLNRELIKTI